MIYIENSNSNFWFTDDTTTKITNKITPNILFLQNHTTIVNEENNEINYYFKQKDYCLENRNFKSEYECVTTQSNTWKSEKYYTYQHKYKILINEDGTLQIENHGLSNEDQILLPFDHIKGDDDTKIYINEVYDVEVDSENRNKITCKQNNDTKIISLPDNTTYLNISHVGTTEGSNAKFNITKNNKTNSFIRNLNENSDIQNKNNLGQINLSVPDNYRDITEIEVVNGGIGYVNPIAKILYRGQYLGDENDPNYTITLSVNTNTDGTITGIDITEYDYNLGFGAQDNPIVSISNALSSNVIYTRNNIINKFIIDTNDNKIGTLTFDYNDRLLNNYNNNPIQIEIDNIIKNDITVTWEDKDVYDNQKDIINIEKKSIELNIEQIIQGNETKVYYNAGNDNILNKITSGDQVKFTINNEQHQLHNVTCYVTVSGNELTLYTDENRNTSLDSSNYNEYVKDSNDKIENMSNKYCEIELNNNSHNLKDYNKIKITNVIGMNDLNDNEYFINILQNNNLMLFSDKNLNYAINVIDFTDYTSGGQIERNIGQKKFTLISTSDLSYINNANKISILQQLGSGASFNVKVQSDRYQRGQGYSIGDQLLIEGDQIGGEKGYCSDGNYNYTDNQYINNVKTKQQCDDENLNWILNDDIIYTVDRVQATSGMKEWDPDIGDEGKCIDTLITDENLCVGDQYIWDGANNKCVFESITTEDDCIDKIKEINNKKLELQVKFEAETECIRFHTHTHNEITYTIAQYENKYISINPEPTENERFKLNTDKYRYDYENKTIFGTNQNDFITINWLENDIVTTDDDKDYVIKIIYDESLKKQIYLCEEINFVDLAVDDKFIVIDDDPPEVKTKNQRETYIGKVFKILQVSINIRTNDFVWEVPEGEEGQIKDHQLNLYNFPISRNVEIIIKKIIITIHT